MATRAKSVRKPDWVSKTDLARYLRCPYAFYLLDTGQVSFEDTVNQQEVLWIKEGVAFQDGVDSGAIPCSVTEGDLSGLVGQEAILGLPVYTNRKWKIYGRPDRIYDAQGAMLPVEIKYHKEVERSDRIELAFYWMLLEPYRTKKVSPRGYLLLHRSGAAEQVEVELRLELFEEVRQRLQEIRNARRTGVQPSICNCTLCRDREEVRKLCVANRDLTLIWGIDQAYKRLLQDIGIRTCDDLLSADAVAIVDAFRSCRRYISVAQVNIWKHHANSYVTLRPVVFGEFLQVRGSFIALDLEYSLVIDPKSGPISLIWLVGACLVRVGRRSKCLSLWADTPTQEQGNLIRLAKLVAAHPSLPVITWSGTSADVPRLRDAARRLKLGRAMVTIESRHVDLFQHTAKAVRFPTPKLGLREVATYFGIPKASSIRDGLDAKFQYDEYRRCSDNDKRRALKADLLQYNRDDLKALVEVAERIAALRSPSKRSRHSSPVGRNGKKREKDR